MYQTDPHSNALPSSSNVHDRVRSPKYRPRSTSPVEDFEASSSMALISENEPLAHSSSSSSGLIATISCFRRYRKRVFLCLLLCAAIAGIAIIVIISTPGSKDENDSPIDNFPHPPANAYSFDDQFNSSYSLQFTSLRWTQIEHEASSGSEAAYITRESNSIIATMINGTKTIIADSGDIAQYQNCSFTLSAYYLYILFACESNPLYRYSTFAKYALFDTKLRSSFWIEDGAQLQAVSFPPTFSSTGKYFSYVYTNNVFIFNITANTSIPVTTDGSINRIINGICDWAYEEEIWGRSNVMFWSPSGESLAWLHFNETDVNTYTFPIYQLPYNDDYTYKYPKVGTTNSIVSVGVVNMLSTINDSLITLWPNVTSNADDYIVNVLWAADDQLLVKTMPRIQRETHLLKVSFDWPSNETVITKLSNQSHPFYLEVDFILKPISKMDVFFDSVITNDRVNLGLYNLTDGKLLRYITNNHDYDILDVLCYDSANDTLFMSANANAGTERVVLMTLVLSATSGIIPVVPQASPRWQEASFSDDCSYFTMNERSRYLNTRLFSSVMAQNVSEGATFLRELKNNTAVISQIEKVALPKQVFFTRPSETVPSRDLNAYLLLPPVYSGSDDLEKPDCSVKFPVLINVYGGPGAQNVNRKYLYGNNGEPFHMYMSASYSHIIMVVDPIGTGGQGDTFMKNYTYGKLGIHEEIDVLSTIEWLSTLCFVDKTRIAYWGWSYGGYMSSRIATNPKSKTLVRTAIAVAPVVDWRLYDSIYTERYMLTPALNPIGYANTSLLDSSRPSTLSTKYFLIHGTADDNVHFQNAALFADKLVDNAAQFSSFFYTNRNHGLGGIGGRRHLYKMLTNWLIDAMQLVTFADEPSPTTFAADTTATISPDTSS